MIQEPRPTARRTLVLVTAVLSTVLTAALLGPVAHADPPPAPAPPAANPVNPADPAAQLAEAQRQAAELTEQWHAAKDDLTNKRAEVERARAAIAKASDADFMVPWSLKRAGQTLMTMPRVAVMRSMVMNHLIHHRAQLGVFLRLNDVAIPGSYGPSADEPRF